MSEKLLTPLEVMPPALRHSIETILQKHQLPNLNPLSANSTRLRKQLEALESLWQELRWEPLLNDLQQRETRLTELKATPTLLVQQGLPEQRQMYVENLQQRKQTLAARRQSWEQKKQLWRTSLQTSKHDLREKLRLLNMPFEQFANEQLLRYDNEWQRAEQRISEQNKLLQQAEHNYTTALRQKKQHLTNAFNELKKNLSVHQQTLLTWQQLRQENMHYRAALPSLVTTWRAEAAAREMSYSAQLADWQTRSSTLTGDVPRQVVLTSRRQLLTRRQQSLSERRQRLAGAVVN
jgi:hypothetical protein